MRWSLRRRAVGRHPRHVVLFAVAAGLLLGPRLGRLAVTACSAADSPRRARAVIPSRASASRGSGAVVALAGRRVAVLLGAVVADLRVGGARERAPAGPATGTRGRRARGRCSSRCGSGAGGLAVARAGCSDGPAPGEGAVLRMRTAAHAGAWPGVGEIVAVAGHGRAARLVRRVPAAPRRARRRRRRAAAGDRARAAAGRRASVDAARRRAEAGLGRGLAEPEAALLRGMVLGQDEQLDDGRARRLQALGPRARAGASAART